jgi:hypothetical protein
LAKELANRGFAVTGLEGSQRMLEFARINAPSARFMNADAREFNLAGEFDAAISVFGSLNHVTSEAELTAVFRNVANSLCRGGLLLFDMNMEAGYRERYRWPDVVVYDDLVCLSRPRYSQEEKLATTDFTLFCLTEAGWARRDLTLTARAYGTEELVDALETVGFGEITVEDIRGLAAGDDLDRAVILAEMRA